VECGGTLEDEVDDLAEGPAAEAFDGRATAFCHGGAQVAGDTEQLPVLRVLGKIREVVHSNHYYSNCLVQVVCVPVLQRRWAGHEHPQAHSEAESQSTAGCCCVPPHSVGCVSHCIQDISGNLLSDHASVPSPAMVAVASQLYCSSAMELCLRIPHIRTRRDCNCYLVGS
jgi:hypothetical protein